MKDKYEIEQKWRNATIQNNFIFGKTMEMHPKICRKLIELILKISINKIHYPEREKVIESRTDSKGIRLDVYIEDEKNRSFDVEMQISNSDNIPKRMRYYQGLIDGDKLKRGQHYSALGESYIIFICPFDRFKCGRHIYTFRERCDEDTSLTLNDGAVKIFLSTKGILNDISEELKNFLNYVDRNVVVDKFTRDLDIAVESVKRNEKARLEFMTFEMYMKEREMEGEERGRNEGREEGYIQMVKNLFLANTPMEYIIKATGWSEEKILQVLKNENEQDKI